MIELINLGAILFLLVVTYFIGGWLERRHFDDIRRREKEYRDFPVASLDVLLPDWRVSSVTLAQGSVVVSVDYFKRVIAGLRGIFGGNITTYEPLLERARREAMLRMIEHAKAQGAHAVINVRLETSRLANATRRNRERIAGVEMLAYGTALRLH